MTHVESPFVARIAGMPASALAGLRSDPLAAHVRSLLATGAALRRDGGALADELYAVIGSLDEQLVGCRPALVGLRRALFGGRRPRPVEWSDRVRAALGTDLCTRVEQLMSRLDAHSRSVAELPAAYERAVADTQRSLLASAAEPALRHGIAQSSPVLAAELAKVLDRALDKVLDRALDRASAGAGGSRPPRAVLARVARYVSRAAVKTSPFSTLTTIGVGRWTTGLSPLELLPAPPVGLLELQGSLQPRLERAVAASARLRPEMLVRVNPSVTATGDGRLAVIGPPPAEPIATVAAVPEVLACMHLLGDGWRPLLELLDLLAGDRDRTAPFVDRLVDVGVLELRSPVEDQSVDWFGDLARWLAEVGGDEWAAVARNCAELSRLLVLPTDPAEVDGHLSRLRLVSAAVRDVRSAAGLPEMAGGDHVHEHAVSTSPVVAAGEPAWRDTLADLDHVRRWLALHDPGLPLRLALGGYLAARFGDGARVPFPLLHRAVLADLAGTAGVGDGSGAGRRLADAVADLRGLLRPDRSAAAEPRLPVLAELRALRRKSLDALLGTGPDPDGVIRIRAEALGEHDVHPGYVRTPESVAWYVQPYGSVERSVERGAARVVLNTAISGFGRGRARALRLIGTAGAVSAGTAPASNRLPSQPSQPSWPSQPGTPSHPSHPSHPSQPSHPSWPGGRLVAESPGRFGHVLNVRELLAGYELDYPYTMVRDRTRPRIPLRDLLVEHDPATGLASPRTAAGEHITVVHNGMLAELLLPPAMQLLVRGLGATPTLFHPAVLLAPEPPAGFAPRIEAGLVTLRRAVWTLPYEQVPRRGRGEADAGYLLRLHEWLDGHGIPDRCFVRAATRARENWLASTFTKTRKPLYVDFAGPWLLAGFERMIAEPAGWVTFTEVLPALPKADDARVVELVIETRHP